MIWYYLVHDNFYMSGLDWGTIIDRSIGCCWTSSLYDSCRQSIN